MTLAASSKILCVGEALLDCISNKNGLSAKDMIDREAWTAFPGGASAKVATACCKLGTHAGFCGCVGQDEDGDFIQRELEKCFVDVSLLRRTNDFPTRRVMVTRDENGDRSFAGFYENRPTNLFADCYLDVSDWTVGSNDTLDMLMSSLEWIVTGTLGLAYPQTSRAIHDILNHACNHGAKLCVDINWRPIFWQCDENEARRTILDFIQQAHVIKLTKEEAEWLFEDVTAEQALKHPETIHKHLPHALAVFVTAGEFGASYSTASNHVGHMPVFRVDAIETTGAGDGFLAGILHGLVQQRIRLDETGDDDLIDDLVTFASAVGALTCTAEGAIAAQPTIAQVESFLIQGAKLWA